jgi:hypothetical protein
VKIMATEPLAEGDGVGLSTATTCHCMNSSPELWRLQHRGLRIDDEVELTGPN